MGAKKFRNLAVTVEKSIFRGSLRDVKTKFGQGKSNIHV